MIRPRTCLLLLAGALFVGSPVAANVIGFDGAPAPFNPFDFNVFSLGDIGTSSDAYSSDFQGIAGLGGTAYFSGFSLHDVATAGPGTPYSLYAGGDVYVTGAINNGGVEAGGSVFVNGASVDGDIVIGGNLAGSGGSVSGSATLAGSDLTGTTVTVAQGVSQGVPFVSTVDLDAMGAFFLATSDRAGLMGATTSVADAWGELQVNLTPGVNVVEIAAADLDAAWGITISGPADATLLINVPDESVTLDSLVWSYESEASAANILLNLPNATTFNLSGGNHNVNILAPQAETHFPHGLVTGNLIAGSLTGGGQVNDGGFESTVPEPATVLLFVAGCIFLLHRTYRRRGVSH